MACPGGNSVGHSMGNALGNSVGIWGTHPSAHSDGLQGERDQGGMGLGLAAEDSLPTGDSLATAIAELVQRQGGAPESLIEVLHQVQQLQGYLGRQALHQVARELQLPLSRVYGVASFYHLFQRRAPASHRIEVCWGTACFVNGAPRLLAQLAERLGVPGGQGRAGSWELRCSGCLGACGDRPVLRLDAGPATRVSVAPLAALAAHLDALGVPAGVPGVVPGSPP